MIKDILTSREEKMRKTLESVMRFMGIRSDTMYMGQVQQLDCGEIRIPYLLMAFMFFMTILAIPWK